MSNFVDLQALIKSTAGGDFNAVVNVLKGYGFDDDRLLQSTRAIFDSIHAETVFTDFFGFWGIVKRGTFLSCANAYIFSVLSNALWQLDPVIEVLKISCIIGVAALNLDVIGALVTGRTTGVYDVGFVSVDGIGDVFNVTQINRKGTQIGYLGDEHTASVPHDSLIEKGYINTDSFVLYSRKKKFQEVYGIEAVHTNGYTTICIDQNAKPPTIVEGILENEPGLPFGMRVNSLVCSSHATDDGFVNGVWVRKPQHKTGAIDLPLLKKKKLAERVRFGVSSVDGGEDEYDDDDDDDEVPPSAEEQEANLRYWQNIDQEVFPANSTIDEETDESVSTQGWFNTQAEAQIIGSSTVRKFDDGFKTLFISNYVNAYGPPVDYLAGL